jgi:hypothetical protein
MGGSCLFIENLHGAGGQMERHTNRKQQHQMPRTGHEQKSKESLHR